MSNEVFKPKEISLSDLKARIKALMTTNQYWMDRLNVPSGDYSHGNMNGWNRALEAVADLLTEVERGKNE